MKRSGWGAAPPVESTSPLAMVEALLAEPPARADEYGKPHKVRTGQSAEWEQ